MPKTIEKKLLKSLMPIILLSLSAYVLYQASDVAYAVPMIEAGVVKVVPSAVPLNQTGTWFIINITVEDAPTVYAVQVELEYDPTVLNATDVLQGTFLKSTGVNTFSGWHQVRHEEATPPYAIITYYETMTGVPSNFPQGSGLLCSINFTVIGEGVSRLDLLTYEMVDSTEKGVYLMKIDQTRVKPTALYSGFYGTAIVLRTDKLQITQGENFTLTCTIYPQLLEISPPYTANITIYYSKGGGSWEKLDSKNVNVPDLEAISVSFVWQKPEAGDYKVKAIARIGDETLESNELTLKVVAVATPWWQSPMFIAAIVIVIVIVLLIIVAVSVRRRKGVKEEF